MADYYWNPGLGYKQDPAQLAQQESERINQLLRELVQENENKAKIKLQKLYQAAHAEGRARG